MSPLVPREFRSLLRGPLGWFYATTLVTSLGIGLTLVFSVVYVHDIRHLSVAIATGLLAVNAVVGLAASPVIGTMTDRHGPVPVYLCLVGAEVVATVSWAFADSLLWLALTSVVLAASSGALFGPGAALLARLVPEDLRQQAFGTNFMILNLGIGIGGLVSAVVVDLHRPVTFTWLYLGTATFGALALLPMLHLRRLGGPVPVEELTEEESREGWREVVADHRLVLFILASIVLLTFGYGSLDAGFSLFVVDQGHLAVRVVSIALFFNTVTIVAAQLFVLRVVDGRSRTGLLAAVSVFWAIAWLAIGASVHLRHVGAIALLCGAQVVFALGETLWSPVGPALVNELAPEHLRGRYNAAFGLTWGLSGAVAPLVAGLFLGSHLADLWPYAVGVGAVVGGVLVYRLRSGLTPAEDGRTVAT